VPAVLIVLAALLVSACGDIENCDSSEQLVADIGLANCTEPNPLAEISLTASASVIEAGTTQQYTATGTFRNGTTADITADVEWSSSDASVVTIDVAGLATGVAPGTATLTAAFGSVSGETRLSVFVQPADPQSASNVIVLKPAAVTSNATGTTALTVDIGAAAEAIGIIVLGTDANLKFIEHGGILLGGTENITHPDGSAVPLSFNQIENPVGVEEDFGDNLLNLQAAALFFPNDGTAATLPAGTYTFPVGSADAVSGNLNVDVLTPFVFYKTSAPPGQTMNVNLFVVEEVAAGITTRAQAAADPEIAGAIAVLRNVYETRVGLALNVTVQIVPDPSFVTLETAFEQDDLLSSFPLDAPSNALNLFIVGELAYLPEGVIGLSAGIPGPFNLDGTIVSGTLAEYQGDGTGNILGFTLAHEFGHFVGLWHTSQTNSTQTDIIGHDPILDTPRCVDADLALPGSIDNCPDRTNLMFPVVDNATDPPISAGQIKVIELNPAVFLP
jgi:hypothetical protein